MTRPLYETSEDRSNEDNVRDAIAKAWGVELIKLPIKYAADYGVYKGGKFKGWLEIKCPKYASSKFPNVILSVDKWAKIRGLSAITASKFILVVAFTDGVYFRDETGKIRSVIHGGRKDRADWQDMEPMVVIPVADFKRIKGEGC